MSNCLLVLIGVLLSGITPALAGMKVEDAVARALQGHPELAVARSAAVAEREAVGSVMSLANPRIGYMRENNLMGGGMGGAMSSWMVSQEIMFPTKYFVLGDMQSNEARAVREEAKEKALEIRQKTISSYVRLYVAQRILALFDAQREALREIARIAESRRATGAVPQQDEMKAHVEQTKLENEIILQTQEIQEAEARLQALMNQETADAIILQEGDFKTPQLIDGKMLEVERLADRNSKAVAASRYRLLSAEKARSLANLSYAPDFMVRYQKPYENAPADSYAFAVEMTIPLWFFSRQTSEVQTSVARLNAARSSLQATIRDLDARVKSQKAKVESYGKLIRVYETALIPQATSTLNSSRAAYSAGRTGFLELLDSERSLYEVRIDYYRTLANFVESLVELERVTGTQLSTLPMGDLL